MSTRCSPASVRRWVRGRDHAGFRRGLTTDQVLRVLRRIEPLDILFVEEPIDPALPHVLPRIGQATGISIAAGERVYARYGFHTVLQTGVVPIIQPDVCNTGGETKKIAAVAEVRNARVAPLRQRPRHLRRGAARRLHPQLHGVRLLPRHQREPNYRPVVLDPLEGRTARGSMPVPTAAGLGAGLDHASLAPFPWAHLTA